MCMYIHFVNFSEIGSKSSHARPAQQSDTVALVPACIITNTAM